MQKSSSLSILSQIPVSFRLLRIAAILLVAFLSTGCHSSKKVKKSDKATPKIETVEVKQLKGIEKKIVEEALTWEGTPYKYGGSEKKRGTDCSGLALKVYETVTGKKLPRNSAKQAEFCKKLNKKDVRPGDLVFFATGKDPSKISHVGIMIGGERFIHASGSKGVIISEMTTPYYKRNFIMYGRVP